MTAAEVQAIVVATLEHAAQRIPGGGTDPRHSRGRDSRRSG
jgi:hypothetical protein